VRPTVVRWRMVTVVVLTASHLSMNDVFYLFGFRSAVPIVASVLGWTATVASGARFAVLAAALWVWIRADLPAHPQRAAVVGAMS
jgi:hypothetical protein